MPKLSLQRGVHNVLLCVIIPCNSTSSIYNVDSESITPAFDNSLRKFQMVLESRIVFLRSKPENCIKEYGC